MIAMIIIAVSAGKYWVSALFDCRNQLGQSFPIDFGLVVNLHIFLLQLGQRPQSREKLLGACNLPLFSHGNFRFAVINSTSLPVTLSTTCPSRNPICVLSPRLRGLVNQFLWLGENAGAGVRAWRRWARVRSGWVLSSLLFSISYYFDSCLRKYYLG